MVRRYDTKTSEFVPVEHKLDFDKAEDIAVGSESRVLALSHGILYRYCPQELINWLPVARNVTSFDVGRDGTVAIVADGKLFTMALP